MTNYSTPKLLPCAHCGSTDVHLSRMCIRNDDGISIGWCVECYDCGIQTQTYPEEIEANDMDDFTLAHVAMDDAIGCAINAWNTRTNHVGFGG